jgi:hypothetical protein
MPKCFMSRWFDVTVGACLHNVVFPPGTVPPTAFQPSIEMITIHGWGPGILTGSHKITTRETCNGAFYTLDTHDCGPMIPDVTPSFPPNPWYAVMWPFSSRKAVFSSSQELAEGKPTACMQMLPIPFPYLTCGEPISMPNIGSVSNFICSKTVDMSWADVAMGVVKIAVSVAIDALFYFLGNKFSQGPADELLDACISSQHRVMMGIFGKFVPLGSRSDVLLGVGKTALTGLTNWGISAIDSSWRGVGNPTLEFKTGGGLFGEASVGFEHTDQGVQNKSDVKPFGQSLFGPSGGGS